MGDRRLVRRITGRKILRFLCASANVGFLFAQVARPRGNSFRATRGIELLLFLVVASVPSTACLAQNFARFGVTSMPCEALLDAGFGSEGKVTTIFAGNSSQADAVL